MLPDCFLPELHENYVPGDPFVPWAMSPFSEQAFPEAEQQDETGLLYKLLPEDPIFMWTAGGKPIERV